MRENCVAQNCVGEVGEHRDLDDGDDFSGGHTKNGDQVNGSFLNASEL
jgi:hypothetical protein